MNVTHNWIPFETLYEKSLIDALTQQRRAFWKCMRFNLPLTAAMANAVATDCEQPTALCILPPGAGQEAEEAVAKQIGEGEDMALWYWRAGEQEMPDLPPVRQHQRHDGA